MFYYVNVACYQEVEPLYVKTTFLYGDLEEDIYLEKSEGLQLKENIRKCIHLRRAYMA